MRRWTTGLKPLGGAFIVCGLILTAMGFGAFGSVASNHQASVSVADSGDAYLGVSISKPMVSASTQTSITLGTITNHFADDLTSVDIMVAGTTDTSGSSVVRNASVAPVLLSPGESGTLTATIDCGATASDMKTVTLMIEASGSTTHVSITRPVQIMCGSPISGGSNTTAPANTTAPQTNPAVQTSPVL